MRRIYLAFFSICLIALILLVGNSTVAATVQVLDTGLTRAQQRYDSGQNKIAAEEYQRLFQYYRKEEPLLSLFVRQDILWEVDCSLAALADCTLPDQTADLHSETLQARSRLHSMGQVYFSLF